jgi:PAS domain S-box-containing protein
MGYKILVVDDNDSNNKLIESMLRSFKEEYSCAFALDGKKGYEMAMQMRPDVILLDLLMPEWDGITCLQKIKQQDKLKDVPVILITAYKTNENFTEAFKEGAFDFITKPVDKNELYSRLSKALSISVTLKRIRNQIKKYEAERQELVQKAIFSYEQQNSFIIIDGEGRLEWANEGFKTLHGFSLEDFKNRNGSTITDLIENRELHDHINKIISEKIPGNFIYKIHSEYYNVKWAHVFISPQLDNSLYEDKFLAFETDVTDLKNKEEELYEQNNQMLAITENLEKANALLEEKTREINEQKALIEKEQEKSEKLLLNILPFEVAKQLKSKGRAGTRFYKLATVMFTDFKNFSKFTRGMEPKDLVSILDGYFAKFDEIIGNHYLEKIKTIGDSYMCAGGLPLRNKSNPVDAVLAGLEIQNYMNELNDKKILNNEVVWELRIGVHTGPLVAGVVGSKKFAYDIWGETVNIASRMEKMGHVGMVNISGETYEYVHNYFDCIHRGKIEAKNIGKVDMYFVDRIKKEYAADELGLKPNENLAKEISKI